ncbi:MAG: hypothetical protein HC853_01130 [Anaerolineae bacterium]|nr:hypothetical protein [Anaerolineae bacterium]
MMSAGAKVILDVADNVGDSLAEAEAEVDGVREVDGVDAVRRDIVMGHL